MSEEPETFVIRVGGEERTLAADSTFEEFDEVHELIEIEMEKLVRAAPVEWSLRRAIEQGEKLGIDAGSTVATLAGAARELREDE